MKKLFILKIGGSVATIKNRKDLAIRKKRLREIAREIFLWKKKNPNTQLIIVHGAGSFGHQIAKKHGLHLGVYKDKKKLKASFFCNNQLLKLHQVIMKIFLDAGLLVSSIHPPSIIIQKVKKVKKIELGPIEQALRIGSVPVLYGDMVSDEECVRSVCSGDASIFYLAKKFPVKKIFFASDIDGVFDRDPHKHKKAKLIQKLSLKDLKKGVVQLDDSHSIDVTGGLFGKLDEYTKGKLNKDLEEIVIFNGLKKERVGAILDSRSSVLATKLLV